MKTLMFAMNLDHIAMMPCNPNIGGTSKGHLVREIDALGGEMGKNIDKTYIQSRMLNIGKGPAVHSLRAQADKARYSAEMKKTLETADNLYLRQSEITGLLIENGVCTGVVSESGAKYFARAVILCAGTYLKARCLYGETITETGPNGLQSALSLSESMKSAGMSTMRFKTGTPARISKKSIDFSKMEEQPGDSQITPFSFENREEDIKREQVSCWLTYTNAKTHEIIRENLGRSPLYGGVVEGVGTRYCPSIEDKVVRFPDRERHQVFIEPEGEDTDEMYVAGMSSSMPEDVQIGMYRTVPGLENCEFVRNAYAIEYDCIDATELKLSLEFKDIANLFSAGQLNGSSGYEEAAAQGLIAGINAAMKLKGKEPVIIDRSQGYIGVLIDDLVVKGSKEPYRMMTSRAEYRLLLRQDNADLRLTEIGYAAGLIPETRYKAFLDRKKNIEREIERVEKLTIAPSDKLSEILTENGSSEITTGIRLSDLIKRPELDYFKLAAIDPDRPDLPPEDARQVDISVKYEGYIQRQMQQVEQFKKLERRKLPTDMDYDTVPSLRLEARQKLSRLRPESLGMASRISGVSPADISVLIIYLEHITNKTSGE